MIDQERFYARHARCEEVPLELANIFFEKHHSQGSLKSAKGTIVNIGLYHEDQLLAVAQWGSPRTAKMMRKYSKELLRLSFKDGIRVVGGASKLIKHFIREYKPVDFFTYQDTTGEATSVYEHAGMTFVSQAKKKQYLVAPGKTLATASRKEALGMAYATRYGPDRILGTKLGELIDEKSKKRKSNKRIFLEDLGWHIEETTGDRVYEWVDANRTYYVYKITATDSNKHYYGVSHVKKSNANIEDCVADNYWGSGGKKFIHWKTRHAKTLIKDVLSVHKSRQEAYFLEAELIEKAWKTDKDNNLNIHMGSFFWDGNTVSHPNRYTPMLCPIHGEVPHITGSGKCMSCIRSASITIKNCPIHGKTKFSGDYCFKCYNKKTVSEKECPIHGLTKHQGSSCSQCSTEKIVHIDHCDLHGKTSFRGPTCEKCVAAKRVYVDTCHIHGEGKFQGGKCYKCLHQTYGTGICEIHGKTLFTAGNTCAKCRSAKMFTDNECEKHGNTSHKNGKCQKCLGESRISLKQCPKHGLVKHNLNSCYQCRMDSRRATLEAKKNRT